MFAITAHSIFKIDSCACTAVSSAAGALESHVMSGFCSVIAGWTWWHSLCAHFQPQPSQMLILCLAVPFPWRIWFIRLLLTILTHAHLLHADPLHVSHVLPGAHRVQCKASRGPRDRGVSCSGNDAPVYYVCDTSLCYVCFACLESRISQGFWGLDSFLSSMLELLSVIQSIDVSVVFHGSSIPHPVAF